MEKSYKIVDTSLSFHENVEFKEVYYRSSSRSQGQRNVRCFPTCSIMHNDSNFCGQPLKVILHLLVESSISAGLNRDVIDNICVVGQFKSKQYQPYLINNDISGKELGLLLKSKKDIHRALYLAKLSQRLSVNEVADNRFKVSATYEFNSELRGWHYGSCEKLRMDDNHCFSISVLETSSAQSVPLTNLRDSSQMETMFRDEIFRLIRHFDSPSFKLGIYRGDTRITKLDYGAINYDKVNMVVNSDEDKEPGKDISSKPRERSYSRTPNRQMKKNTELMHQPQEASSIFGLPRFIWEDLDYSSSTFRRFGFSAQLIAAKDSSKAATDSFLNTLPKLSILSSILSGELPEIQLTTSLPLTSSNLYLTNPTVTGFPLVNVHSFVRHYSSNIEELSSYTPPIYRVFPSAHSKDAFIEWLRALWNRSDEENQPIPLPQQKLLLNFWFQQLSFPMAVEPILLYLHYHQNVKDQVLLQYRLAYIHHLSMSSGTSTNKHFLQKVASLHSQLRSLQQRFNDLYDQLRSEYLKLGQEIQHDDAEGSFIDEIAGKDCFANLISYAELHRWVIYDSVEDCNGLITTNRNGVENDIDKDQRYRFFRSKIYPNLSFSLQMKMREFFLSYSLYSIKSGEVNEEHMDRNRIHKRKWIRVREEEGE